MIDNAVNEYVKIKSKMGLSIDNAENRFKRGIYADISNNFGGTQEEIDAEFKRRKQWIKTTYERLLASDRKPEQQEGKAVKAAYDALLEGSENINDVNSKIDKNNVTLVEFWRNKHADRKNLVQESAEHMNNMIWEDVENYTATKLKGVRGKRGVTDKETKDMFEQMFFSKNITTQVAGAKNKKTRQPDVPPDSVLDLDFDTVQSSVFYQTNYDVETSKAVVKLKYFFKNADAEALLGGSKNTEIILDTVRQSLQLQRGHTPPVQSIVRAVTKVANIVQAKGIRIALGSVTQIPKQYISVAISTWINLGSDIGLYFKAVGIAGIKQKNFPLFEKYNIGLRGSTQAGYNKEVALGAIDRARFGNSIAEGAHLINKVGKQLSDWIMYSLTASDVAVARTSWLAYYMQDLKRQGVDVDAIDWKTHYENSNDEAAAYAEQMTSRSQNANDASSMANFYKNKNGLETMLKNTILPFSTFSVNQRVRMTNDVQKLWAGDSQAKIEATRSLIATAGEQVAYNALKIYLIGHYSTSVAQAMASIFGFWDDEDEKELEKKRVIKSEGPLGKVVWTKDAKKLWANTFSDYFFSGIGNGTQYAISQGMNWIYKSTVKETYVNETDVKKMTNKYPSLYFTKYDDPNSNKIDLSDLGTYGIAPAKIYETMKGYGMLMNGREWVYKSGKEGVSKSIDVEMTEDEKRLFFIVYMFDAMALVGVSEGFVSEANTKLKAIAEKKMAKRYGAERNFPIKQKGTRQGEIPGEPEDEEE